MVRKFFEKDMYYIGPGDKYTYWNVFPDEEKQSRFSYHISTVGNHSSEFENMYYDKHLIKADIPYCNNVDRTKNKNSEENMALVSEEIQVQNSHLDSCRNLRNLHTEDSNDVRKNVYGDLSNGTLRCDSSMSNSTYAPDSAKNARCHIPVGTKKGIFSIILALFVLYHR